MPGSVHVGVWGCQARGPGHEASAARRLCHLPEQDWDPNLETHPAPEVGATHHLLCGVGWQVVFGPPDCQCRHGGVRTTLRFLQAAEVHGRKQQEFMISQFGAQKSKI